jgi:hypothetical protein
VALPVAGVLLVIVLAPPLTAIEVTAYPVGSVSETTSDVPCG